MLNHIKRKLIIASLPFFLVSCAITPTSKGGIKIDNMIKLEANDKNFVFNVGQISLIPIGKPRAHFQPNNAWLGDAHPVYKDGRWYLYYLNLPFNTTNRDTLQGVKQGLAVSDDLINWEEITPEIDNTRRSWWAIANTLVDGKLYSMFNDVVTNSGYGLAISDNLVNFNEYGVVYPYSWVVGEPRDPSLFYDEINKEYYFIYANKIHSNIYDIAQGEVYFSKTKDFKNFSEPELLYHPNNANIAECNEFFKLGKYYYLIMNWGTNRVGGARYRVLDKLGGSFKRVGIDTIQSTEFMAPNSQSDGENRYTFGWIPTYQGNKDGANYQWGGALAFPLQLYNDDEGRLYTKLNIDDSLIQGNIIYDKDGNLYDRISGQGWYLDKKDFYYAENNSYGEIWLDGDYINFDLALDIELGKDNTGAGISFKAGNKNFNGYEIFIDPLTNQLIFRNHFERREQLVSIPVQLDKVNHLRVILDGSLLEVYLNDRYALSARAHINTTRNKIGIFTEYGSAAFKNISIHDLKKNY